MKNQKAFSLIELSIVILIIGIIIAGVTQGSRLVSQFKLSSARTLTQSSPVAGIKGLAVWYESTSEQSFNDEEQEEDASVTIWKNINPQTTSKIDAIPVSLVDNSPQYKQSVINGLPALRFPGTAVLKVRDINITGDKITYFVVAKRILEVTGTSTISGVAPGQSSDWDNEGSFVGFYEGGATFTNLGLMFSRTDTVGTPNKSTIATHPGNGVPYVAAGICNGVNSILYLNGAPATPVASVGPFNVENLFIGARWDGGDVTNIYNGDIAEVIVFDRALKAEERKSVTEYLGKKWGIKISQ